MAIVLACLVLTACSGMRGALTKKDLESSKNVAVASLLGENFNGIHIGTTVFNNVVYEAPVPGWNIDGYAEELVINKLNKAGLRTASALEHDDGLYERLKQNWSFVSGFDYSEFIELAKSQGADTLILVQPIRYDNQPFHEPGYGFYERSFLSMSRSCVYSLFVVTAFSTDTGRRLGWEWGFPCESGEYELQWKESFDQYSEKEMKLLREKVENSVKENIWIALVTLGY